MRLRGRRTERTDLNAQLFGSGISTRVSGRFPVPGNAASPRGGQSVGRSQVSIGTPHPGEVVMLSKQDNRRNIARGTATTIRICEKGEMKETEAVGKEDHDRG